MEKKSMLKKAKTLISDSYVWQEGEEVAIVTKCHKDNTAHNSYIVPWSKLHYYIAVALTSKRQQLQQKIARLDIKFYPSDKNEDLFAFVKKSDVNDLRGEEGEEGDSDEEVDNREEEMKSIETWVTKNLNVWEVEPKVDVKIRGTVFIVTK